MKNQYSVVLFDGVCHFCNASVQFIVRHDSNKRFRFASLQSEIGKKHLADFEINQHVDSIVLIEDHLAFIESTAVLKIFKHLDGFPKLLYVFVIFPRSLRDFFYRRFAEKRYQFFGKQDTCIVPSKEIRERFLDFNVGK